MKRFNLHSFLRFSFSHLLLSLFLVGTSSLSAQVHVGNLILNSQADVDAFAYTEVTGTLAITSTDISNLASLSSLTSVGGFLLIGDNNGLTNLDGLSSLTSVVNNMEISNTVSLTNIDGLSSLTSVGGSVTIIRNASLPNINGLSSLTSVGGSLAIDINASLTNIDGLSSLTSVGQSIAMSRNPSLTNIDGFSSLSSAGGLYIYDNPALVGFCGLYTLLDGGWTGFDYSVYGNSANPTEADILTSGPCLLDLSQILADLQAAGTINQGQANALQIKVNKCNLNALNNQLSAFVNAGILTQVEANDLSTAANQTCNPPARMTLPQTFVLGRSYPNPAKTYTMIPFTLSTDENIKIDLYDASGKEVIKVLNKPFFKGKHEVKVDLRSLPAGTYFYKLTAGEQVETLPIVVE